MSLHTKTTRHTDICWLFFIRTLPFVTHSWCDLICRIRNKTKLLHVRAYLKVLPIYFLFRLPHPQRKQRRRRSRVVETVSKPWQLTRALPSSPPPVHWPSSSSLNCFGCQNPRSPEASVTSGIWRFNKKHFLTSQFSFHQSPKHRAWFWKDCSSSQTSMKWHISGVYVLCSVVVADTGRHRITSS